MMAYPASQKTVAISLLPCATDCVLTFGLTERLAGRTHECSDPSLTSVPVCTKPKLAPTSSILSPTTTPSRQTPAHPPTTSSVAQQPQAQSPGMTPLETHLAQSTARAAAWELCWGVGVPSAFGHVAEGEDTVGAGEVPVSRSASLLVEWGLSPFLTDPWLLRKLQPDVILTQLQPVEGAFTEGDIRAALEHVVGRPVMVLHLDPLSLPHVFADMLRISRALGAEDRGTGAVREMRRRMRVVQSMCSGRPRKRVLCLQWLDPAFTAGAWVPQLIRLAGGIPVGPGLSEETEMVAQNLLRGESSAPQAEDGAGAGESAQEVTALALRGLVKSVDVVVVAICGCDLVSSIGQVKDLVLRQGSVLGSAALHLRLQGGGGAGGAIRGTEAQGDSGRGCPVAVVDGDVLFSRPGPGLLPSLEVLAEILHPEVQGFGHQGCKWSFA